MLTSSALSSAESVSVRITNGGMNPASGFTLSYSINNNIPVDEPFPGVLNPGATQDFDFSIPADLSTPGHYVIKVWLSYVSDLFKQNDTLTKEIRQISNPVITLPWAEGFEGSADITLESSHTGITQLDPWDIILEENTRLRTFAGTPFCHSGARAMTVDAIRSGPTSEADILLTLNMASYSVVNDDIRLSLYVMHHELIPDITNTEAIWVRGSDTDPFVLLTDIPNTADKRGIWQHLSNLSTTSALIDASQDFSSSFQIKFSHGVFATAGQLSRQDGQTLDDLTLIRVERDLSVSEILHPAPIACGLGTETIQVRIENTTALEVTSTYVYYQLNEGMIHSTFLGTVPANTSINFSLTPEADFSATGLYTLKTWASSTDDIFHANDTQSIHIIHTPMIDTYPYVEGFEEGDGGWLAGGIHSSWAHGVPGKQIISRAAEGQHLWTTSLNSAHNADEISYLYSPCFDLNAPAQWPRPLGPGASPSRRSGRRCSAREASRSSDR
jgi:hypothetical protein